MALNGRCAPARPGLLLAQVLPGRPPALDRYERCSPSVREKLSDK